MKSNELEKNIKASVRKNYVRKSRYNKLKKQFDQLQKRLAKLEKRSGKTSSDKPKSKKQTVSKAEAKPKTKTKTVEASTPTEMADDLIRIKGIGPVLQGKLNNLGINSLAQIAAWSAEDIERVSEHLDFKGRIEREEWIKQAQELLQMGQ